MEKGLQYLENVVKVNTEVFNKLSEMSANLEDETGYLTQVLNAGIGESLFRIKEAQKAAKGIFDTEITVKEEISAITNTIQPSYYVKDNKLYTSNGTPMEEAIEQIKLVLQQKQKPTK